MVLVWTATDDRDMLEYMVVPRCKERCFSPKKNVGAKQSVVGVSDTTAR
jgi:hypothetical protein